MRERTVVAILRSLALTSSCEMEITTMKIYGHPWSINTRKVLMALAEKEQHAELVLVMVPKGEHKHPEHLARHPFGKVPTLEDDGFVLYETGAINRYIDRKFSQNPLTPADPRGAALVSQWISTSDSYFAPHAQPLLVETMFRRYLGGAPNQQAIDAGRENIEAALTVLDRWLATHRFLAGDTLSLADIHWLPYLDYLVQSAQGEPVTKRPHLKAFFDRMISRPTWQRVARTGPQPYDPGMTADVIEKQYRG